MKHHRLTPLLPLALAPLLGVTASAQTIQLQDFVVPASDAQQNDEFSSGLALDGDRLVVGAARADIGPAATTANQGITYVFDFDGTNWVEQALLRTSDAALGDEFGGDLDVEGDRFVAGARLHDLSGTGDEGAAYVFDFDGTTWTESQKLTASDAAPGDNFGNRIRMEGAFTFVSAPFHDAPATTLGNEGAVYVFQDDGTSYAQTQQLVASDAGEEDEFGFSIDVDGDRLVVGARGEDDGVLSAAGAAYVFEYDGSAWVEVAKVLPSARQSGQQFGTSIAVDGDRLAVGADGDSATGGIAGAGAVWVFEFDGVNWNEVSKLEAGDAQLNDLLGTSCWLQGDFIAAGAIGEDTAASNAGAVYLYEFDGGTWNEIAKLLASNGGISDDLGREVVVHGDNVVCSSRVAKPLVGSRVGGAYFYDTSVNAAATHADFVASPQFGTTPVIVDFTDATVGGATSWSWDFGDGNTSTAQSPTHTYYAFGTFDVTLTVTAALGGDSITKTGLIVADPLMASSTVRNGSGTNDTCYGSVTDPVLGGTLTTTVDGTNHPSAGLTLVLGYDKPLNGVPTPYGELLVAPEPFGGFFAYGTVVNSGGGIATHNSAVPTDITFIGIRLYSQGVILGGAGPELCNAIDLVIGY